jgi:farnesyl-diphosphate farnesyltransferase
MPDLDDLLEKTSRTFALSIPLLEEPTRREVTVAYLLFRIADTFEDAAEWPPARRIRALGEFAGLLGTRDEGEAERLAGRWTDPPPVHHDGYLELLSETSFVLDAFRRLDDRPREIVRVHTVRTAEGMAGFVERTDESGDLKLRDIDDLKAYTYVVAGIVGEMLTELFLLSSPSLESRAGFLRERAGLFGEALQLVNILKDSAFDLSEGRSYLPGGATRAEVFDLARRDLVSATEYVLALFEAGAHRGMVEFTALPLLLAWASLDRVEEKGAGAKLTRPEVFAIVERMQAALDRGEAPVSVPTTS